MIAKPVAVAVTATAATDAGRSTVAGGGDASDAVHQAYRALGEVMAAVGTVQFGAAMFAFTRNAIGADHVVSNLVGRHLIQGLFTEGLVPARVARTLNQRYLERYHLLDKSLPSSWDIGKGGPVALPFDSQLNGSPIYSAFFFERVGLCDKISLISSRDDSMVVCNLYRLSASGKFSPQDLRTAQALALPLTAAVWLHSEQLGGSTATTMNAAAVVSEPAREALLKLLSRREMEVCRRLLAGASNEGVALDLAISTHTVRTLRKRIYKKLQVSSLTDLFSQYLHAASANSGKFGDAAAATRQLRTAKH